MKVGSATAIQICCEDSTSARLVGSKLADDVMAGQFQVHVGRRLVVMRSGRERRWMVVRRAKRLEFAICQVCHWAGECMANPWFVSVLSRARVIDDL